MRFWLRLTALLKEDTLLSFICEAIAGGRRTLRPPAMCISSPVMQQMHVHASGSARAPDIAVKRTDVHLW